ARPAGLGADAQRVLRPHRAGRAAGRGVEPGPFGRVRGRTGHGGAAARRPALPPLPPQDVGGGTLRIALAQVNATVGDLDGNAGLIVEWTRRAAARGARVVVFPEMMLTGYPVEDLALRASFVEASIGTLHAVAARLAAEGLGGIA